MARCLDSGDETLLPTDMDNIVAPSDLLNREDVLILDTETTGLNENAEIVAIVDTTGTTRYSAPIMPKGRIPSADIHGLTQPEKAERTGVNLVWR